MYNNTRVNQIPLFDLASHKTRERVGYVVSVGMIVMFYTCCHVYSLHDIRKNINMD